ncbi:SEC-C domain-containing protein [Metabacillus fastidiosus]|uniref:YecA family protein n=1 Tax=Metabacillus fastidiosus TaxID=1458 RepID=UPI002E209FEB|nr:SEC-C domain-containing protein [Metabacillus fastidiosus]
MKFENLKKALDESEVEVAASILIDLFKEAPNKFKKSLLLSNSLPEPFDKSFSKDKLNTLHRAFLSAGKQMIDENIDIANYVTEFNQLLTVIRVIAQNAKSNSERLGKNSFSEYSLSEQLQMFCIYIEDQHRLSNEKNTNNKKFITGMENEVAKFDADNMKGVKMSETDRLESLLEIADTLFRYLYFKGGKNIEKVVNFQHESITPYRIESFEEIMYLALDRNILEGMWEKVKYREWELGKIEEDNIPYYIFIPNSKDNYKMERIAINRYVYRDHINIHKANLKYQKENRESIKYIEKASTAIDVNNIKTMFLLEKGEFLRSNIFAKNLIEGTLKSLDEIYYKLSYDGLKISDIFKGFEYLFTMAMIYKDAMLRDFDQDNISHYKRLSPIVEKDDIIKQFSDVYDLEDKIAEKVINNFIFSRQSSLDVFSQPLVYVGKNKVIFCPTLILQMNIVRIIEMLASELEINIAQKGLDFEKDLRFIFSYNPYIQVNTNKIEFKAYDGKEVEFDFIGYFEDHLLLIEFKHVKIPFSDKMKKNALDTIDIGIEQINRRVNIIQRDWDKVRENCSFELPIEPPAQNKIIKLVCTNIFDFSTIIRKGVEIIDASSLLKFFMSPEIKGIVVGDEVNESLYQKLWQKDYPSVEEFKLFLKCPVAIKSFINCYEHTFKPLMKIEESDYNIGFFDYSLTKDPFGEVNIKGLDQELVQKKVSRNEKCPCESGKKYKKCCGA